MRASCRAIRLPGGRLIVKTELPFRGEDIEIRVEFPFDYPDVEPMLWGLPDLLARHQNRGAGNFCLLEDPSADWWPGMAAAKLVDEDLRWLLEDSKPALRRSRPARRTCLSLCRSTSQPTRDTIVLVPDPFWTVELDAADGEMVLHDKMFGTARSWCRQTASVSPTRSLSSNLSARKLHVTSDAGPRYPMVRCRRGLRQRGDPRRGRKPRHLSCSAACGARSRRNASGPLSGAGWASPSSKRVRGAASVAAAGCSLTCR